MRYLLLIQKNEAAWRALSDAAMAAVLDRMNADNSAQGAPLWLDPSYAKVWRSRADARLNLTRDKKQGLNDPDASEDWTPVDAGSLTAKEAALACKGDAGGLTPVPDLKAFAAKFVGR